jgi:phenylacetate-CoA ligase
MEISLARCQQLSPLLTDRSRRLLTELWSHPAAPRWNHAAGDRLIASDLAQLAAFAEALRTQRGGRDPAQPAAELLGHLAARLAASPLLRERFGGPENLAQRWTELPTTKREDLASAAARWVPDDAALERLIVYRTAGTTGHALQVPQHPLAVACYSPLLNHALERHGRRIDFHDSMTACFLVGAQRATVAYPAALAQWGGAGFCKLNLTATEWPTTGSAQAYFDAFAPAFLTGDPLSFAVMAEQGIRCRPAALVTTAVAMSAALKDRLEAAYACPVIDWYSLTETGPLAYACAHGPGYHWLPHDIHLETLDADGRPTTGNGEIVVSGGRNPYLPLLRYRTGDWGRIDTAPCSCGDPMPRLLDLEGRVPVRLEAADGTPVNSADVSRVLREFPVVQHELLQRHDRSLELHLRPLAAGGPPLDAAALGAAVRELFRGATLELHIDADLADRGGKALPYRSERDDN